MVIKKGGLEPLGGKLFAQGLEPSSLMILTNVFTGIF
jgi:hypothetical protein